MKVSGRLRARTGTLLMAGVCLLGATAASADSQPQLARLASYDDVSVAAGDPGMTSGRLRASGAAVVGLISVVIGGLALARAGRIGTGNGRAGAIAALPMGLIGTGLSVLHLANSTGGFGTGGGRAGAIVGLVLGLIGMNLGGLALARARRTG